MVWLCVHMQALEEAFEMLQSDLYPPFLASEQVGYA